MAKYKRRKKTKINKLIIILMILVICTAYRFYKISKGKREIEAFSEAEGKKYIDSKTTDWDLILVNKENYIPNNYDIEVVNLEGNWKVDSRIKESAAKMLKDARKEGLKPIICSAYRSSKEQEKLFDEKVKEYTKIGYSQKVAKEQAALWVTVPGTSEHELGLSLDIVGINYQILDENQEDTEIQKWLMEHCYEYGFILRYPTQKKDITKINYEPWHYRYVGIENAMIMKEKDFCLEEYIEYLKKFE